uniref:Uncharacterized protein n=1 Tax=Arion vulgaris TaxID=1028688 RepID=A0A0B6ZA06_9EUPU
MPNLDEDDIGEILLSPKPVNKCKTKTTYKSLQILLHDSIGPNDKTVHVPLGHGRRNPN